MLDLRRKHMRTGMELRAYPRIELRAPVTLIGNDSPAQLIEFSLGGFFIEIDTVALPKVGQRLSIVLQLPGERNGLSARVEVVYSDVDGFGCRLLQPTPELRRALHNCFHIFSETLPVADSVANRLPFLSVAA